jgi:hypothetical protein
MDPLTKAERYLRRAEECIALAKAATSNKVRAHHYAIAERYVHLAQAEPTVANQGTGSVARPYSGPVRDQLSVRAPQWQIWARLMTWDTARQTQ